MGQGGLALALLLRPSHRARRSYRCGVIHGGVQAQSRDNGDGVDQAGAAVQQLQHGIAAVRHGHQRTVRQPASHLEQRLPAPIGQLLAAQAVLFLVALRGRQDRKAGQRPHPLGPRYPHQHLHGDPAQATGLDKELLAGAHRVTIDAPCRNLDATAALDGVVHPDDDRRTCGDESPHQEQQEDAAHCPARPASTVEHPVVVLKLPLLLEAHHPQHGCHGPLAWRQQRPDQQYQDFLPDPFAKGWFEVRNTNKKLSQNRDVVGRRICMGSGSAP